MKVFPEDIATTMSFPRVLTVSLSEAELDSLREGDTTAFVVDKTTDVSIIVRKEDNSG